MKRVSIPYTRVTNAHHQNLINFVVFGFNPLYTGHQLNLHGYGTLILLRFQSPIHGSPTHSVYLTNVIIFVFQSPIHGSPTNSKWTSQGAIKRFQSPIHGSPTDGDGPVCGKGIMFQSPIHGSPTRLRIMVAILCACFNPLYTGHQPLYSGYQQPHAIVSIPYTRVTNEQKYFHLLGMWFVSIPYTRVTNYRGWFTKPKSFIVSIPYTRVTNIIQKGFMHFDDLSFNPLYTGHQPA